MEQQAAQQFYEKEIAKLTETIHEKNEEIARLSRAEKKNYEEIIEMIRSNIHIFYKEREEFYKQRFEGEKVELMKEINTLIY